MKASAVFWLVLALGSIHMSAQEPPPAKIKEIIVGVHGSVNNPGRCVLPGNATVRDAVAIAGGPIQNTDLSRTSLRRKGADGKFHTIKINVDKESTGISTPTVLQSGDYLFVRYWNPVGINL